MKIVVCARCRNEENNIARFLYGYSFVDQLVVSDGGSTDESIAMLEKAKKVKLYHFEGREELENGYWWNPDAPHMNFVLNKAKELEPDWLIFDDLDDVPNHLLRENARYLFEDVIKDTQVNAFRLYMWGETQFFPKMNNNFDPDYRSLWAWKPKHIDIHADEKVRHGTLVGLSDHLYGVNIPMCLLHYSWSPATIEQKLEHYKKVGFQMHHPFNMSNAKTPVNAPEWARPQ
jgi:glycosyltransferase involved in cell wall biosynthesis